jgi:hypothetical protein
MIAVSANKVRGIGFTERGNAVTILIYPAFVVCERSVGTVFQLSNSDAIYSRDEEKERRWLPPLVVRVCAQPMRCWAKVGDHCRSKVRDRKEGSD